MHKKNLFSVLGFVALVVLAIAAVKYIADGKLSDAATIVGAILTPLGIFLAFLSLRESHEWNRRHYTIELMGGWNPHTREHLAYLTGRFPDFFTVPDFIDNPHLRDSWRIDPELAKKIVFAKPDPKAPHSDALEIQNHLIALLNYFESVATAYENQVVDHQAIEETFGTIMVDTCTYFRPFIDEMRKANRRDPWPPLSRIVDAWEADQFREKRERELEMTISRYKAAAEKAEKTASSLRVKQRTGLH